MPGPRLPDSVDPPASFQSAAWLSWIADASAHRSTMVPGRLPFERRYAAANARSFPKGGGVGNRLPALPRPGAELLIGLNTKKQNAVHAICFYRDSPCLEKTRRNRQLAGQALGLSQSLGAQTGWCALPSKDQARELPPNKKPTYPEIRWKLYGGQLAAG